MAASLGLFSFVLFYLLCIVLLHNVYLIRQMPIHSFDVLVVYVTMGQSCGRFRRPRFRRPRRIPLIRYKIIVSLRTYHRHRGAVYAAIHGILFNSTIIADIDECR